MWVRDFILGQINIAISKQRINVGTGINTGTGDTLRAAMEKVNNKFDELFHNKDLQKTICEKARNDWHTKDIDMYKTLNKILD